MTQESDSIFQVVLRRALAAGDPDKLQVHFAANVLDRYRGEPGYSLIRTNTIGRLRKQGDWGIDFGITAEDTLIHASFGDLARLPELERDHWAFHATILPASKIFLQARLSPAACLDDGEVRPWE